MEKYLFRISLTKATLLKGYTFEKKPKPLYYVGHSKDDARKFAESRLKEGLLIKNISCLARQVSSSIFSGEIK